MYIDIKTESPYNGIFLNIPSQIDKKFCCCPPTYARISIFFPLTHVCAHAYEFAAIIHLHSHENIILPRLEAGVRAPPCPCRRQGI